MSNSKPNNNFFRFLSNKDSFNEFIKKYPNFIPSYYFNDTSNGTNINNNSITNYFKIKFYLKAYLQNITNILNIIKLNEFDLKSIEINDIKMKRYNFSENIFNFHLEDTGNTFFKNDRLFMDEMLKRDLVNKGYTLKKPFLKSSNTVKYIGNKTKNISNSIKKIGSVKIIPDSIKNMALYIYKNITLMNIIKLFPGSYLLHSSMGYINPNLSDINNRLKIIIDYLKKNLPNTPDSSNIIKQISTYTSEQINDLIYYLKEYEDDRENMLIQNFLLNKNVFNNIKFPLYITLIKDNYNKNSDNKKYYLQLFKSNLNYIDKLFNNKNIIGISSFSPLFEIIEGSSKNNSSNNENKETNINKEKNKGKIYIIGSSNKKNTIKGPSSNNNMNKKNKFYENIPENSNLYQTYDINNILDNKVEKNNEYFKIFYDAMKNISNRKYDNLYDYIINSLLLEQNFILFITSWIEAESFKKIFRLDNLIKGDINKNIDLFMQYYGTFKPNESNINSLSNGSNVFNPINFNKFFDSKFAKPIQT